MDAIFEKLAQYNFWDGRLPPIGYIRKSYVDNISRYVGKHLVKVLAGQRRVGKSYILRQIIYHLIKEQRVDPRNIFYLNKELLVFDEIRNYQQLTELLSHYKERLGIEGKVYVFLDEVQEIAQWEVFVNSCAQDYLNPHEVFVTGSNASLLSGELASLLTGRYVQFEVFPFSFVEYCGFTGASPDKAAFLAYLQGGGLPEILHLDDEEMKRNYIQSLKDAILLRDIVQRHTVKDVSLLDDLFKFVVLNVGHLTSVNRIVKYFKHLHRKVSYEKLANYLSHLRDTFVVHEVERFDLRGKRVLGGIRKYYLNDLSFKNYLFGIRPDDIGNHLENYVYVYLRSLGYKVSVGIWGDREIDFIAQKGERTLYIQVAYLLTDERTISREFGNLLRIKDNYEKIVISMDDVPLSNYDGVEHIRPWEIHRKIAE